MQQIKTPLTDKLIYALILIFCFGTPLFILKQCDHENRQTSLTVVFTILYFLGIYSIFNIYKNSKSVFVYCSLKKEGKKMIIEKLAKEKKFKVIQSVNSNMVKLHYKKYALGLDYVIHFYIHESQIEFNAFCNQPGIFDFGTRKRIVKKVKDKIVLSCASL